MAITKTIEADNGLQAPDAYHRVTEIQLIGKDQMTFVQVSHRGPPVSEEVTPDSDCDPDAPPPTRLVEQPVVAMKRHFCPYDPDGPNPFAQAYTYLKVNVLQDATDA